ncbi:hypothetical protein R1sor_006221 [Riccia sorocarpa]|uniref:BED-type domain-containing protein n=1 Tax=Riccia sorocarpa TaxID=122646 RepID=A0ABD3HR50_9MARC
MEQFTMLRTHRNGVEVVCCKCKWCGNQYTPNVTRLTQHFTNEFAPRQRGTMEVATFKKDGSNRHIKGCECAIESLKFEIRALNARQCGRMAEQNNSANEPTSFGNVRLNEEDREIEQAFPRSILEDSAGTPSACFHNNADNVRAQHSNFSSPSSIANDSVHSSSQPFESQPRRTQPYIRRTVQLPLKPMMDAAQREKTDRLWAMAQQVASLPFRVFSHPAFQEAYNFSIQFLGYKFPGEKKLWGPLLICDRWRNWVYDPLRHSNAREGAEHLKTMVLDDEFWDKVHDIVFMMEMIFILLHQVDAHKDFMGMIYWESWETQDDLKYLYKASVLKSNILTAASCDQVMLLFRHRWNGWTNCIHTTTMLLNLAYLWDEDRQEVSHHNFIMEDFHEYVKLFANGVLKIIGEELRQYIRSVDRELDGITCMDTSIWTQEHREKTMSEECRTATMLWWAQAGRNAPLLRVIAMNILGLTFLEARGPEIGLSTGERVRIKTWDWTEPVSEEELLDDKLQERSSRDNPQRDGQSESNVDLVENVFYYDDIGIMIFQKIQLYK